MTPELTTGLILLAVQVGVLLMAVNPIKRMHASLDRLTNRIQELEDRELVAIHEAIKESSENSYKGRQVLHERINTECVFKADFEARVESVLREIKGTNERANAACLDAAESVRSCATLVGEVRQLTKSFEQQCELVRELVRMKEGRHG